MHSEKHKGGVLDPIATFRVGSNESISASIRFLQALGGTKADEIIAILRKEDHSDFLSVLGPIPLDYGTDLVSFRNDYCAFEFLSKSKFLNLGVDKVDVALKKFHQFEEQCLATNRRFTNLACSPLYKGRTVSLLHAMTRKISSILTPIGAEEFANNANWGPGSSYHLKGDRTDRESKFRSESGITRDLLEFVKPWFHLAYPGWSTFISGAEMLRDESFLIQNSNKVITVPKSAKTDRVIAVEPGFNLFFQKSLGLSIRHRLNKFGIDLNSQEINQQLAKRASLTGHLATVDFSSASDSISLELIREVLPHDWFQLLDICRTKYRDMPDLPPRKWEKFSSMGNGFTFELESLVFFSAAYAVCEELGLSTEEISVFGDDVILPIEAYQLFSEFCAFLGFSVNNKKSHFTGLFRESCGAHWFAGLDCKPIYLKDKLTDVPSIFKLANSIRRLSRRHSFYGGCDHRFRCCWLHLFRRVPKPFRFCISDDLGDGGFIVNFDEASPSKRRSQDSFFTVRNLVASPLRFKDDSYGTFLARLTTISGASFLFKDLMKVSKLSYGNTHTKRDRYTLKVSRLEVFNWIDLGPWVIN